MHVPELLRQARARAGMSRASLAQAAGLAASTVGRIEDGQTVPRIDTLRQLLLLCGQDLMVTTQPYEPAAIAAARWMAAPDDRTPLSGEAFWRDHFEGASIPEALNQAAQVAHPATAAALSVPADPDWSAYRIAGQVAASKLRWCMSGAVAARMLLTGDPLHPVGTWHGHLPPVQRMIVRTENPSLLAQYLERPRIAETLPLLLLPFDGIGEYDAVRDADCAWWAHPHQAYLDCLTGPDQEHAAALRALWDEEAA